MSYCIEDIDEAVTWIFEVCEVINCQEKEAREKKG